MNDSIRHQDASGAVAPLGVFHDGELVEVVPPQDRLGDATRERVRNRLGDVPLEVLIICRDHPDTAAVDCLICVPEDRHADPYPPVTPAVRYIPVQHRSPSRPDTSTALGFLALRGAWPCAGRQDAYVHPGPNPGATDHRTSRQRRRCGRCHRRSSPARRHPAC